MNNLVEDVELNVKQVKFNIENDGKNVISECTKLFGEETINDLLRIYSSVWGCDAYRFKDKNILAPLEDAQRILSTLLSIARSSKNGLYLAKEISESVRYSYGTTTDDNYMRQITSEDLQHIASLWSDNLSFIEAYLKYFSSAIFYHRVWAEWNTYIQYIDKAKELTQDAESDTFEGISKNAIETYKELHPSLSEADIEKILSCNAHIEFEKADLIGLCAVFKIMRHQPSDIIELVETGNWGNLFYNSIRANLYGEGRYHQNVQMVIGLISHPDFKQDFNELLSFFLSTLQSDYRKTLDPEEANYDALFNKYEQFLKKYDDGQYVPSIDLNDCQLIFRQKKLRQAEDHLHKVEQLYAERDPFLIPSYSDPIGVYSNAMNRYVDSIEKKHFSADALDLFLNDYRNALIHARHSADQVFKHDYYFWTGFGDNIGQIKSRSLHQRVQLYYMEAYAERLYLAGKLVYDGLIEGNLTSENAYEAYIKFCEQDERPLYVQEWITNYGARRSLIFGYSSPETIKENEAIIRLDSWVFNTRQILINHGVGKELWGPLATGYTERLRFILKPGNGLNDLGITELQQLLDKGNLKAFSEIVKKLNPYDHRLEHPSESETPYISAGMHIHNVRPVVFFETMVHLRELDWPLESKWSLMGTTTSKKEFARLEHKFAIELGLSRFGISNRQLLKGGNQNRILPNIPKTNDREIFYFTIDDDYVVSPQTLHRLAGILYNKPDASYSQTPLFFRAIYEPGHSIGRHLDGTMLLTWSTNVVPAFNDTSFFLPLGTGTLFRITPGKNDIEMTGGMVVDPTSVMSGEDWAYGTVSMLMRFIPEQFAETCNLEKEELAKRKKRVGYYITEDWVVGDGVDFAPGSQRQKARWNETCTRIFRSFWLPAIKKHKGIGDMDHKSFHIVNYYMIASWMSHILSPLVYFVIPFLAFTPYSNSFNNGNPEYALYYWALFVSWVGFRTIMRRPAYKLSGVPFFEVVDYVIMLCYGTFWSYFKTSILSFITKPQYYWKTHKGKQNTTSLKVFHVCLGLFHLSAALYSLYNGSLAYTWYLLTGLIFIYTLRYHENAATDQKDKINKVSRDVKVGFRKKLSMKLSGQGGILGRPIVMDKNIVLKSNIVLAGELLFFGFLIIGIRFYTDNSTLFTALLASYLFLVIYLGYKRLIIQKQAFKNVGKLKNELGAAKAEILIQKINSFSSTHV